MKEAFAQAHGMGEKSAGRQFVQGLMSRCGSILAGQQKPATLCGARV
jgi:hypothetical protein